MGSKERRLSDVFTFEHFNGSNCTFWILREGKRPFDAMVYAEKTFEILVRSTTITLTSIFQQYCS